LPSRGHTAALALAAVALLVATLALPARSPLPAREDVRQAWSSPSPQVRALRLERAEASLADALRLRPADAESWLLLAGVRAARGDARAGAALARHAAWLDPQRANLLAAASRLARTGAESP
jgi:cytochrome c-type biogenesis protein CcmH/NrfG